MHGATIDWLERNAGVSLWHRLYEPTTALTDFGLAAQTGAYAVLLRRGARSRSDQLWIVALGAAGVAALAGGLHHSFHPDSAPGIRKGSWQVVGIATGLAGAAMLAAGVHATVRPQQRPWWLAMTTGKAVIFGALNLANNDFRLIIADYASSMIGVLALMLLARKQRPGSRAIVLGILVSFLAAGVQMSGFSLHKHLNHNDLYHLVQALGFHLLYQGAHQEQPVGDRVV
jgi:hypothetical protein